MAAYTGTDPSNLLHLLVSFLMMGIEGATLVFFIVLAAISYRDIPRTWRRGLVFAVVAFVLGLPSTILGMAYLDMHRFGRNISEEMLPVAKFFAIVVAGGIVLAMIPLRMAYYHVAVVEWRRVRGEGQPLMLSGRGKPWRGVIVGIIVGSAAAVLTDVFFVILHVQESKEMLEFTQNFQGLQEAPALVTITATLGFGVAAAIVEELIFRGGMLGFLLRITKNQTMYAWVWIVATSFLWAFLHFLNTDNPGLKLGQIFLLGLAFGYMARRWGLASSIAGHVSLNVVVIVSAMFFRV